MKIDNNYTHSQPNFGRLKSIKYGENISPNIYSEEIANLLRTIKESKAFNEFFNQYDVDLFIHKGTYTFDNKDYVSMSLKTTVPKTDGGNWHPELNYFVKEKDYISSTSSLINKLAQNIEKVEPLDLKYHLSDVIKKLEKDEKNNILKQQYRAEIDDITNSLLSQDEPKKKSFFKKVFDWLMKPDD